MRRMPSAPIGSALIRSSPADAETAKADGAGRFCHEPARTVGTLLHFERCSGYSIRSPRSAFSISDCGTAKRSPYFSCSSLARATKPVTPPS